jgi:hypothetical protein
MSSNELIDSILGEMKQSRTIAIDSVPDMRLVHKLKEIAT